MGYKFLLLQFSLCLVFFSACPALLSEGQPLTGRVETIEAGSAPQLPSDLLSGGVQEQDGSLPAGLRGTWYGRVQITQMETYPSLHEDAYSKAFIKEIQKHFWKGKGGQLVLSIDDVNGRTIVGATDIHFTGGFKLKLTASRGPALVEGGRNIPATIKESVTRLSDKQIEHSRFDTTTIIDQYDGRVLAHGFTEVSAVYEQRAPKRIRIKLLNVDYDHSGKPLWKALMQGEATR